jgi:hypothetical protein
MSNHAQQRCQSRGVRKDFVTAILQNADVECAIGDNCRLLRVSHDRARKLNINDQLGRYAVIWSDDTTRVVTVMPLRASNSGVRYRRRQ